MTPSRGKERLKLLSVAFRFESSLLHYTNTFKTWYIRHSKTHVMCVGSIVLGKVKC